MGLAAHPEVSKLQGPEWKSKWITLALVGAQIWLSVATVDLPWPTYLAVLYVFGATITQALFLAIHELAHDLFFKTRVYNRYFSFIVNWPISIPYTIPFRGYHLEHHKFQGIDGVDTDIATLLECRVVRGPVTKIIWACCQILTYAIRPCLVRAQEITAMHAYNWIAQIAFDAAIYHFFGWRPL